MLLSWKIFKKSVLIVLDNLKEAFRVSGAIFVAAVFASSALNVFLTGDLTIGAPDIQAVKDTNGQDQLVALNFSSQKITALMGGNLIFFIAMSWIAIAWHRFILIEESTNYIFPIWDNSRIIKYSIKTIAIVTSVIFLLIIPFSMINIFINSLGLVLILPAVNILLFISFYYLFFRAGLVLPSIALDKTMSIKQSFFETKTMSKEIWGLAVIVIVMILGIGVISGILAPNNIIGVLVTSLFQWIVVMVSASLMTTLYGHIIERRPIL